MATFSGQSAVQCMLRLRFARDAETAIDYLNQIMECEAPFARINGDALSADDIDFFAEDATARYQWIVDFVADDDNNPISPESVMIGVRHSYGGLQRMMKHNRSLMKHKQFDGDREEEKGKGKAKDSQALMRTNSVISTKSTRHGQFAAISTEDSKEKTKTTPTNAFAFAPETPTKMKVNPFSTRSLLSSQTPSTARKSAIHQIHTQTVTAHGEALPDDGDGDGRREIARALVLVAGADDKNKERTDAVIELFEETYKFTVMAAQSVAAMRQFNAPTHGPFDGVIAVLFGVAFALSDIESVLTRTLRLRNVERMPKLLIAINCKVTSTELNANANAKEMLGVIESAESEFVRCFVDEMRENHREEYGRELIKIIDRAQSAMRSRRGVRLKHFDPHLLLYEVIANRE